ncbi:release factor glutamine methyltransferase [Salibacterium salarium]|uniref:peptide chain release factor N(5)-glutamine methyltransferase n=1 Tax=Salibacterium salarium TaxID=284579 RepID=UPI002786775D|nr:peptide chain release factor N(5)-glutamine methyltransferase [Salibacterium salarium]MDQ0297812.1 release factor glutamine methyltransferase [Salibacterium salarium]
MQPTYVYEALNWASSFLEQNNKENRAADILLKHHLNVDWTDFHLSRRDSLSKSIWKAFQQDVTRHSEGIPIQHLTGYEEFYDRRLKVNEHVLIPRTETEELVHGVLEWLKRKQTGSFRMADIGTGSGAIAISLALEAPGNDVTAVDLDEQALDVAKQNAAFYGADVTFLQGNLVDPLLQGAKTYDVIVSNPPYIPLEEWKNLDTVVRDHEPKHALVDSNDNDGLACYRKMAAYLPTLLRTDGLAAFEIGENQGDAVATILQTELPLADIEVRHDMNGKPRMVFCERDGI